MLESIIASHCAPALAGIKPSNMISYSRKDSGDIAEEIRSLNEKLNVKDIYIDVLCSCPRRYLLIVYRKKKLTEHLSRKDVSDFLAGFGYAPGSSLEAYLEMLREKIQPGCSFPHETGAFLGYPIDDISGFIEKKECLYTGAWKVYSDVNSSRKMFERYKSCRAGLMRRYLKGQSLDEIFFAA